MYHVYERAQRITHTGFADLRTAMEWAFTRWTEVQGRWPVEVRRDGLVRGRVSARGRKTVVETFDA